MHSHKVCEGISECITHSVSLRVVVGGEGREGERDVAGGMGVWRH